MNDELEQSIEDIKNLSKDERLYRATLGALAIAERGDETLSPQMAGIVRAMLIKTRAPTQEDAIETLDERMKAAGMIPLSELLTGGQPLDKWMVHTGTKSIKLFQQWVEKKHEEFMRMRMRYELGDKDKGDDLYEWVFAHAATFGEVSLNLKQALEHDDLFRRANELGITNTRLTLERDQLREAVRRYCDKSRMGTVEPMGVQQAIDNAFMAETEGA